MPNLIDKTCERDRLLSLLQNDGVVGISRLHIHPAFTGPVICTLIYSADSVRIDIIDKRALGAVSAREAAALTFRGSVTKPLSDFRKFGSLASWERLRETAFAATSCSTLTCDGVSYRHALLDFHGGTEATWNNPGLWPQHRRQIELVDGYAAVITSSGILLEVGTQVRIRSGLMAGFVGRVNELNRNDGRVKVVADLGGSEISVDLSLMDIAFAGDDPA